jgi:DNA-binding CsgD family transcriptional regulator
LFSSISPVGLSSILEALDREYERAVQRDASVHAIEASKRGLPALVEDVKRELGTPASIGRHRIADAGPAKLIDDSARATPIASARARALEGTMSESHFVTVVIVPVEAEAAHRLGVALSERKHLSVLKDDILAALQRVTVAPKRADPQAVTGAMRERERTSGLTRRERQVLTLLSEGKSNREIAEKLMISQGTVHSHVAKIFRKLGIHSRRQLVGFQPLEPETHG